MTAMEDLIGPMTVRYPKEAQLKAQLSDLVVDTLWDAMHGKTHRWVWTARGFLGTQRWYTTAITERYDDVPEARSVQIECARMFLEDLLITDYRTTRGRVRAAWRDVRRHLGGKMPMLWRMLAYRIAARFRRFEDAP